MHSSTERQRLASRAGTGDGLSLRLLCQFHADKASNPMTLLTLPVVNLNCLLSTWQACFALSQKTLKTERLCLVQLY